MSRSVSLFVLPVCVSHPKRSEMTARSGAPGVAEPALTQVNTHTQMYAFTQADKKKTERCIH